MSSLPITCRKCIQNAGMNTFGRPDVETVLPFCPSVDKFESLVKIGQGTFGEVFKAHNKLTGEVVALKKILMENETEGFPLTAVREIKILQRLKHENIVQLLEICHFKKVNPPNAPKELKPLNTFYLAFEFCDHDLAGLLLNPKISFGLGEIKRVMQQLLNGLYYIHTNKILHRDMKAANILITKTGVLKLADFGLSRTCIVPKPNSDSDTSGARYTNKVVTLWYRAPELLLGDRDYGYPIDIWGAGCILAEMWFRRPIFQGCTEQQVLQYIIKVCGSITPEVWPKVANLELYQKLILPKGHKPIVKDILKNFIIDKNASDLLEKMLTLDPSKRINADSALDHDFFWTDPMPCDFSNILPEHNQHMFEFTSQARKMAQSKPLIFRQPAPKKVDADTGFYDRVF